MAKKEICDICKMWCQLPGKFEGNTSCQKRAEAIYEVARDGCDAETGSVTEDGVWFGLLNDLSDVENDVYGAKAAVIMEDDEGFVTVAVYDSAEEATAAFEDSEEDLADSDEQEIDA
jgi:hypothetical protein